MIDPRLLISELRDAIKDENTYLRFERELDSLADDIRTQEKDLYYRNHPEEITNAFNS